MNNNYALFILLVFVVLNNNISSSVRFTEDLMNESKVRDVSVGFIVQNKSRIDINKDEFI